jgi:hypothetical protein
VHKFLTVAICVVAVLFPLAAAAADFSGSWSVTGTLSTPRGSMNTAPICTFKQDDNNRISGTCKGPSYLGSADGAVDGQTIVWHWNGVATNGNEAPNVTATFKGTLGSDGIIRGTWTDTLVPEGASGIFTAQRTK